jgi:DNA modification methylase
MTPTMALEKIQRAGLTQHRDVTRHFSMLEQSTMGRLVRQLPDLRPAGHWINRAHDCRFQQLLPKIPDRSIQILAIDPPYVYGDATYGSRSARSLTCDCDDAESAIGLAIDLLRDWQPKLAPGGVVLLWQPWQTLLAEIAEAIHAHRWSVVGPVIWDKGRPQPGNFVSPYSVQGEMLWVLHRPGDALLNHDGSSRETILRFAPVSFPGLAVSQAHAYEKPQELCAMLVHKHSNPGDLIADFCGCTGAMTAAAITSGRRWLYVESNPENFALGEQRIAACLGELTASAS